MVMFKELRHLTISIERSPQAVYAFASNPENLPRWAAGLGQGIKRVGDHWQVKTGDSTVDLRFTPQNEYGVMDHTVTLADGTEVYVPLRVIANGEGSEVSFVLYRQLEMTDADFARDAGLMQSDLLALKTLLERQ